MYFKLLKRAATVSCYSLGGLSLYYLVNIEKSKIVQNSWTSDFTPSLKWDSNWDHRACTALVKPLAENASAERQNEHNEKLDKHRAKAIRHIILIRHGQYNIHGITDKERVLTELGRAQAKLTGDRLKELEFPISDVVISTMTRAQETGKLILGQLTNRDSINVQNCGMLEEGAVYPPEPKIDYWNPDESEFFTDNARIEAAFRKYVHRAAPEQKEDSYTALVCHGNVIRYFVCRALQFPPEAWLRMSLHHASITWLVIHPSGRVVLRLLGDCGHMSKKNLSVQ
ncbi:hypothetical protein ACKWTF_009853 [Chironomus riparius]